MTREARIRTRTPGLAVGYVRVSTERQADSGLSIEAQQEKVRALATVHDVELFDVVIDAGQSAKSLDRPGWKRIMAMVDRREVGAVLVAKLDRCTRSLVDLGRLLDTFGRRQVALVSAAESLDTSTANGRFTVGILGLVASWEREVVGERTSAALQVLKAQGRATGGTAPYGYRFVDGRREVDHAEQATLAAIAAHRTAGLSWAKVAAELNAAGHRTRTGAPWSRQGAHHAHRSAAAVLPEAR